MNLLRHYMGALILVGILIGLYVNVYTGFNEQYDFTEQQSLNGSDNNVMVELNDLGIVKGMSNVTKAITKVDASGVNENTKFDITGILSINGATALVGLVTGVLSFPFQIIDVISNYFSIPGLVVTGVIILIIVYIMFILFSKAFLKGDI